MYADRGVVFLPGLLGAEEVTRLQEAVDDELRRAAAGATVARARFHNDAALWRRDDRFRAVCLNSRLPAIAARLMRSMRVTLLLDELFVKEPQTPVKVPWHNDLPYWPVAGDKSLSFWLALDRATVENGLVEYVAGSHRWGMEIRPQAFAGDTRYEKNLSFAPPPDIDAHREAYDIVSWPVEPGDGIAFHGLTLHGSSSNDSCGARRRA